MGWIDEKLTQHRNPLAVDVVKPPQGPPVCILTEFVGVNNLLYVTRVFASGFGVAAHLGCLFPICKYNKTLDEALAIHNFYKAQYTGAIIVLPEPPVVNPKKNCIACGAVMEERTGKYGKFYACSAWKATGCKGSTNAKGKPSIATIKLYEKRFKRPYEHYETPDDSESDDIINVEIE
jgi:hypothetical protein